MEDFSNFESSSTDVPGNYPEVLMTEGQGDLLIGIDRWNSSLVQLCTYSF